MQAASLAIRAVRKPRQSLFSTAQGKLLDRNFHSTVSASATPFSQAQPSVLRTFCGQLCAPILTSGFATRAACSVNVAQTPPFGLSSRLPCIQALSVGLHDHLPQQGAIRLCSSAPVAENRESQNRDVSAAAKAPKHTGRAGGGGHSSVKSSQRNTGGGASKPSKRPKKHSHKRKRAQPVWRSALGEIEDNVAQNPSRKLKHRSRSDKSHEWTAVDREPSDVVAAEPRHLPFSQQDSAGTSATIPQVLQGDPHASSLPLSKTDISAGALQIIHTLRRAGFPTFLVGGAVRDILLGNTPKDFDVLTAASNKDVKSLFGKERGVRCMLVGRRFPIAHVTIKGTVQGFQPGERAVSPFGMLQFREGAEV